MVTWKDRMNRMHASIVGDFGPSRWATYTAPNGTKLRLKGTYESPYRRQGAGDFDTETYVVSQVPQFGARHVDFTTACPARQNGLLQIDDEPGVTFRITKIEEAQIGWVHLLLERKK